MYRNHFKLAFRHLMKQRLLTIINAISLSIGISVAMLILIHVRNELSYDRFHENSNRIVRVLKVNHEERSALTVPPLGQTAVLEFPEVANSTHIFHHWDIPLMSVAQNVFYEEKLFYVDEHFLDVFSFPLLRGEAESLAIPFSIMLTESTAKKYFGTTDVIGERITMNTEFEFRVTGVLADQSTNSHISFDLLASTGSLRKILWSDDLLDRWNFGAMHTFLLLEKNARFAQLQEKMPAFCDKYLNLRDEETLELQPLENVHLYSNDVRRSLTPPGDINAVYVLIVIAVLILAIACINYINIQTARSFNRAKEVGLYKVVGAHRITIVRQFLVESYLTLGLVVVISHSLIKFFRPVFSQLVGDTLTIDYTSDLGYWLMLTGILAIVGLFACGYPAIRFSGFQPVEIFRRFGGLSASKSKLRRILVILQFAASSVLIIGTLLVREQVVFLQSHNLGFDKEQVVIVPALDKEIMRQFERLKLTWEQHQGIERVSSGNSIPGRAMAGTDIRWEGYTKAEPEKVNLYFIYYDYFETLGMKLMAGRNFAPEFPGDEENSVIINEELANRMGILNPADAIGRNLMYWDKSWNIVGVVKDFNFRPLHDVVTPLVIRLEKPERADICVRLSLGNPEAALAFMQETWSNFSPNQPFMFSFLDEQLNRHYLTEKRWGEIVSYTSMLAIFVACMGLFGLASFLAEQRTREIGIRKILGASLLNIVGALSREFLQLVFIGVVLAVPLTLLAADSWLQSFAYRINIDAVPFVLAGILSLLLTLATTSVQALRAGRLNPVDAIKYE